MRLQVLSAIAAIALLSCDENRLDLVRPSGGPAISLAARSEGYDAVISWSTTLPALDEFLLERSLGDTSHFLPLRSLRPTDTAWRDTFPTPDMDRWYRMRAIRASDTVATSAMASCRPLARPEAIDLSSRWFDTLPGTPPIMRADTDSFKVVVQWREYTGPSIDGFLIERSIGDTSHFAPVGLATAAARRWDDTSATTPSRRWYRIRLRVGRAVSKPSNIAGNMPLLPEVGMEVRLDGTGIGTLEVLQGTASAFLELANVGGVPLAVDSIGSSATWLRGFMDDSAIPVGGTRMLRLRIDTAKVASSGVRVATLEARTRERVSASIVVMVVDRRSDTVPRPRLRGEAEDLHTARLAWDRIPSKLVPGLIVQRMGPYDTAFIARDTIESPDTLSWSDPGLIMSKTVLYRLVARDADGDTAISNVVGVRGIPPHALTVLLRDVDGRALRGLMWADSSNDTLSTDSSGSKTLEWSSSIPPSWTARVPGYLAKRFEIDTADTAGRMTVVLDLLPTVRPLEGLEGTDFRAGALQRDTAWLLDGDADGTVLLTGHDLATPSARTVRRILGRNLFKGAPGALLRTGPVLVASFPFDGTLSIAQVATNSVKEVRLTDSVGDPWGLDACPSGFAVAGSGGVGLFDSSGRLLAKRPLRSVVDDVASLHGGRVACTGSSIFVADNGAGGGLVRVDRSSGIVTTADLQGRSTARFLAADISIVATGTVGGATASVHVFDHSGSTLGRRGRHDLPEGATISALALAEGRDGATLVLAAISEDRAATLAILDATGRLLGTISLDDAPIDLSADGAEVLLVYPDRAELLRF